MLPDRVSNPGPLTYESGALPTALRGPVKSVEGKPGIELGTSDSVDLLLTALHDLANKLEDTKVVSIGTNGGQTWRYTQNLKNFTYRPVATQQP